MADAAHPGGIKGVFKNDTTAGVKSTFKSSPSGQSFKLKVKHVAYKFGGFMHWIFFKPDSEIAKGEDPAETSKAPINRDDAGKSAAEMDRSAHDRTMAATRDMVAGSTPSEQQLAGHAAVKDLYGDQPQPAAV